jgi:HAD family hydrolase
MGNAKEELKEIADYITSPIDQDGIWNACRHFQLV